MTEGFCCTHPSIRSSKSIHVFTRTPSLPPVVFTPCSQDGYKRNSIFSIHISCIKFVWLSVCVSVWERDRVWAGLEAVKHTKCDQCWDEMRRAAGLHTGNTTLLLTPNRQTTVGRNDSALCSRVCADIYKYICTYRRYCAMHAHTRGNCRGTILQLPPTDVKLEMNDLQNELEQWHTGTQARMHAHTHTHHHLTQHHHIFLPEEYKIPLQGWKVMLLFTTSGCLFHRVS